MRALALMLVLPLAAAGCGESHTTDTDAGPPDAGSRPDAGPPDTGPPPPRDAGRDASAPVDSGPILPPIDAGDPFGDAGTLGTPEWVSLDIRVDGSECDPLVPCGGDEEGTWDATGGCVAVPISEQLERCPGAMITRAEGIARGRVTFASGIATRTAQSEVQIEIFVPSFCAAFVGGCSGIETQIRMAAPDSRCVMTGMGDCTCAARTVNVVDESGPYTIEGNQIVAGTGDRRWDYCIEGTTMRYHEVADMEPGIVELGRR